jgi:Arc/MetJ-type ribon-helix-helix transcriptional regulator
LGGWFDFVMNVAKIAISIAPSLLGRVDALVSRKVFRSRSEIFQVAVSALVERFEEDALLRECARLDPEEEQRFADMGHSAELTKWPAY